MSKSQSKKSKSSSSSKTNDNSDDVQEVIIHNLLSYIVNI